LSESTIKCYATKSVTVINYVNSFGGVNLNAAFRKGPSGNNADGATSGEGSGSGYDFALTTDGSMLGIDGLALGAGYGQVENAQTALATGGGNGDKTDITAFVNYSIGPVTLGYQMSAEDNVVNTSGATTADQEAERWGIAFNINENLSVSYGEAETEFLKPSATNVTEDVEGIAIAYTMGSMKIAGNRNEGSNMAGTAGANDEMTEIAVSFAF